MNLAILTGNLSKEPELRKMPNGNSVVNCTIASNEQFGEKKTTTYVDFSVYRQSADFLVKWFHKGDPIEITGRLVMKSWTDKEGKNRSKLEVDVNEVKFCPRKGKSDGSTAGGTAGGTADGGTADGGTADGSTAGGTAAPAQGGYTDINVSTDDDFTQVVTGDDLPF